MRSVSTLGILGSLLASSHALAEGSPAASPSDHGIGVLKINVEPGAIQENSHGLRLYPEIAAQIDKTRFGKESDNKDTLILDIKGRLASLWGLRGTQNSHQAPETAMRKVAR